VDLVVLRVPLPRRHRVLRVVLRAFHVDRVGGAGERAELTPDAFLEPVLVAVQQVPPHVRARRRRHDLLRVLLGDVATEDLAERDGEPTRDPDRKPVAERLRHTLLRLHGTRSFRCWGLSSGHTSETTKIAATTITNHRRNGPLPYTSGSTITTPVNRIQNRPTGIRNFQPKFIS